MATPLDLLLETEGTAGFNTPVAADAGRFVMVNAAGDNHEFKDAVDVIPADGTVAAALAPHLASDTVAVDGSDQLIVQPRMKEFVLQDHFALGGTASGEIGLNGWRLYGAGTPTFNTQEGTPDGVLRGQLGTSSAANDSSYLSLGRSATFKTATVGALKRLQCVLEVPALTNRVVFFGMQFTAGSRPTSDSDLIGFLYDSSVGGNWQILSKLSGSGSPVDTGVAVSAATNVMLSLVKSGTSVVFYIGGTAVGTVASGSYPTGAMTLLTKVQTLTTSTASVNPRGFLYVASLGSAFDDDTFLDA